MSTNLVIVAIPEEQDRVWKLSSEKIPHLTLLFLGKEETADTQQIMQFVEHATALSEHGPFYLDVDRRGTLGEDEADAIFFSKRSWNLKWIKQFRGQLLQNQAVRSAYDSAEQFPEWNPHLTMGYPATPPKDPEDGHDHPLYSVAFDRIAVWTGNYEGPEFRLEWPERELEGDLGVAYSDAQKAALMHYGVAGMRKGQGKPDRIDRKNGRDPKRLAILYGRRRDKKEPFAVQKKMADHVNQKVGSVNGKYKDDDFSNVDWGDPASWNERTKEYHAEVIALTTASDRTVLKDVYSTEPKGKRRAELNETGNQLVIREDKVKHAVDDDAVAIFKVTRDARGFITNVEPLEQEEEMSQTAELGEEFLEHYGAKGMKWGVRNHRESQLRGKAEKQRKSADRLENAKLGQPRHKANRANQIRKAADRNEAKADQLNRNIQWTKSVRSKNSDRRFAGKANSNKNVSTMVNKAGERTKQNELPAINAKHKGLAKTSNEVRLVGPSRVPAQKAYREDVRKAYEKNLNDVANETTSKSGRLRYEIRPGRITGAKTALRWSVKAVEVKHAETDVFDIELVEDEDGFITDFKIVPVSTAIHGEVFVDGFVHGSLDVGEAFILEHYGVKGMQWGKRRAAPQAIAPTASSRVPQGNKRKTKIDSKGGQNHPASNDAIKVEASRAKLKKSGPKALSNQELRDVADRLRLEQAAVEMDRSRPKAFVRNLLGNQGKQAANQAVREGIQEGVAKAKKTR